jgi:hypothetical protein
MIMKFCPNYRCAAYGRVVYTQSTRCVFCRWDLKPPRMKSETAADETASTPASVDKAVVAQMPADSRAQNKRATVRPSA